MVLKSKFILVLFIFAITTSCSSLGSNPIEVSKSLFDVKLENGEIEKVNFLYSCFENKAEDEVGIYYNFYNATIKEVSIYMNFIKTGLQEKGDYYLLKSGNTTNGFRSSSRADLQSNFYSFQLSVCKVDFIRNKIKARLNHKNIPQNKDKMFHISARLKPSFLFENYIKNMKD